MNNYVLYGYGESVASNVVRLALAEKNISYDYKLLYLESRGDHLKDDYKKLNPKTLLPTLTVNEKPISESIDIMRFIDNEHTDQGSTLFPKIQDEEFDNLLDYLFLDDTKELGETFGTTGGGISVPVLAKLLCKRSFLSVLWDYFRFYGAEKKLNEKIHDAFKAHCSHQMLPMELPGKLSNLGFTNIKNKSLSFVITHRDQNSPAKYAEDVIAFFVKSQGISETEVNDWKEQINRAEKEGRFGLTSFQVLTEAYLNKI